MGVRGTLRAPRTLRVVALRWRISRIRIQLGGPPLVPLRHLVGILHQVQELGSAFGDEALALAVDRVPEEAQAVGEGEVSDNGDGPEDEEDPTTKARTANAKAPSPTEAEAGPGICRRLFPLGENVFGTARVVGVQRAVFDVRREALVGVPVVAEGALSVARRRLHGCNLNAVLFDKLLEIQSL